MKRWLIVLVLGAVATVRAQDFKAYQNYDFVPGDKIVFEDDFRADTDGEFPAHWKLLSGQAVVNKMDGVPLFALTEGNYVKVEPRMKAKAYLTDQFTVEFDTYPKAGGYNINVFFQQADEQEARIDFASEPSTDGFGNDLTGRFPPGDETMRNKWHHVAIAFKKGQLKVYMDQFRTLVLPETSFVPQSVRFGGIADADNPLMIRNVRIALGGGMNLIDKLTKDGKFVTYGIQFDVNQSTLKAESMGAISQVVKLLKDNPAVKLEIGGHTDATGDAAKNQTLSQARADAVKKVLVDNGIEAARLTTKGYGAAKPVDSNDTPEGRANNRRVEFTKTP
jgi:outer membrane protein OmpA-like peptidoglycan-associated protein